MKGCVSFKASRSESKECPTRMVVGVSISSRRFWMSASDVVTGSIFSGVIPENLVYELVSNQKKVSGRLYRVR